MNTGFNNRANNQFIQLKEFSFSDVVVWVKSMNVIIISKYSFGESVEDGCNKGINLSDERKENMEAILQQLEFINMN